MRVGTSFVASAPRVTRVTVEGNAGPSALFLLLLSGDTELLELLLCRPKLADGAFWWFLLLLLLCGVSEFLALLLWRPPLADGAFTKLGQALNGVWWRQEPDSMPCPM